jgi:hypothetical protein
MRPPLPNRVIVIVNAVSPEVGRELLHVQEIHAIMRP